MLARNFNARLEVKVREVPSYLFVSIARGRRSSAAVSEETAEFVGVEEDNEIYNQAGQEMVKQNLAQASTVGCAIMKTQCLNVLRSRDFSFEAQALVTSREVTSVLRIATTLVRFRNTSDTSDRINRVRCCFIFETGSAPSSSITTSGCLGS